MSDVFKNALPLALGAAISPILVTVSVLLLASGAHAKARAAVYLAGVVAVLLALGIAGLVLFNDTVAKHTTSSNDTSDWISLIAGIILLVMFIRGVARRNRPQKERKPLVGEKPALGKMFLTGCVMMLINFSSIVLYIPMLKEVARAQIAEAEKVEVLLVSIVIISVTAWFPLVLDIVLPKSSQRVLEAINHWTTKYSRTITNCILLIFGVYLIVKGSSRI